MTMRTVTLCVGLVACLALIAVGVPDAVRFLHPGSGNTSSDRGAGVASRRSTVFGAPNTSENTSKLSSSAETPCRRLDLRCRDIKLRLGQRSQQHRRRHHQSQRRHHHKEEDALLQSRYRSAVPFIYGAVGGIELSGLTFGFINEDSIDGASAIFPDSTTFPSEALVGVPSGGIGALSKDAQTLSGGSITDTSKLTVNADSALQLFSTPNWSFIAKFGGEFAPEPQLYAGSGTIRYTW
jgi:hypothetical protein